MKVYLLIDFGSTYTKLTAIDLEQETILATAKDITTIESNIMNGFEKAYEKLIVEIEKKGIDTNKVDFVKKVACSSAAGGLKMYAIGLVPALTADAAKKSALGAGARVMKTYSYELNRSEAEEIRNSNADILLLAGGTDGGNKKCIIHNAKMIADVKVEIPVLLAGNKSANDEIIEIFDKAGIDYRITENVMPTLNKINEKPTRDAIRDIFMTKIVEAKGMKSAEEFISGILMPTPAAVLKAAEVLSEGSDDESGLGNLMIVDIGGATTDIHSLSEGDPTNAGVIPKGLEEPFAKRTVEGDLGMRYSALSLLEAAGTKKIRKYLSDSHKEIDVKQHCNIRHENIMMVPKTEEEIFFDEGMAGAATEIAMMRHCGWLESVYTPMGITYFQHGKDLLDVKYVIGTGGVLVHSKNPKKILKAGEFNAERSINLMPRAPKYLIDSEYILSAMGLLAGEYPDMAVRIMKKYLKNAN